MLNPNSYFNLPEQEQRELIRDASTLSDISEQAIEKDIMVTWVLQQLFESEFRQFLDFKGGTSLSKCFGIITRISEDVDITVNILYLIPEVAELWGGPVPPSRNQARKWRSEIGRRLNDFVANKLKVLLEAKLAEHNIAGYIEVPEVQPKMLAKMALHYQSLFAPDPFLKAPVLLEFTGRSTGKPAEERLVECYAKEHVPGVAFPEATVNATLPKKTAIDKLLAMHRFTVMEDADLNPRSRDWYDMFFLDRAGATDEALADHELALSVAVQKNYFYRAAGLDYIKCLTGELNLDPQGKPRDKLNQGYQELAASTLMRELAPDLLAVLAVCENITERANDPKRLAAITKLL